MPILINYDVNDPSVIVQNFETSSTLELAEVWMFRKNLNKYIFYIESESV